MSPKKEKYENGNEGTSARTRPFTFEEIMLRRKKNISSSEVEGEAEESEKLLVKDNDVTILNHSKLDEAHEEIKTKASDENEKISSTREQESTSVEKDLLGRKDNVNFDAKSYIVEKLDKEVSDGTKEEKSEVGSRCSRNEEIRADLEYETEKDMKSRVEGDKKEKHSHHRSRDEERLKDNLENEPDKVTKSKSKSDKNEKSRHYRIRNEEISRDDMEVESNKDIRNEAKGDKNKKQGRRGSRNEERSTDVLENKADKDMRSKAKADKHDEIPRTEVEVQSEKKSSWRKEKSSGTEKRKSDTECKRKQRPGGEEKDSSEVDGNAVKKHDSGKRYDLEAVGRKGRRELSPSHYDEERPKRRRSRSREKKDKDRRSISDLPSTHKRTSYKEWEHAPSRKLFPDADKNKMLSNSGYGSSHYHRHGGHESRLGGYSPRKRRTDSAVKTPSPTARSPERKSAGWDFPPTGTDISSAGSILSNLQNSHQIVSSSVYEVPPAPVGKSNSATKKAVSGASSSILSASKNSTADNVQPTSPRRRLCVENVPTSASDKNVMECFNNFFLSSDANHIQGTLPCIRCSINKEKGQALVEFLTPGDATTALSFNGRLFSGSILKVRRPKDFAESATGVSQKPMAVVDEISNVVKDSSSKVFVGGIAKVLTSDMGKEIASAFGALRAYHFEVNESANEACAFLEYVDKSITLKACAGLNGMKLGGEFLTVVQATPDASTIGGIEEPPRYTIPEHAKPLLSKATKVLKLHNVLNEEELSTLSGQEVEEVLEDVRLECARYGAVKSINIIRNVTSSTTAPGVIINQASLVSSSPQIEDGCNMKKVEPTGVEVDSYSGETSGPAALGDVRETLVDGADAANSRPSHGENEEDNLDTIIPISHLGCDTVFQESPSQLDKSKNQSLQTINSSDDFPLRSNSCTEDSAVVEEEELKPKEADLGSQKVSVELNDTSTKNESKDMTDVFEEGCILVEYARTEASCVAAHSLHGRLFGDRIVAVGYVDHDQYMSRFPK